MKLPKTIKEGPYDYKVKHKKIDPECERVGDFDSTTSKIRVTTGLDDIRTVETLMHEICHAIFYSYGISNHLEEENIVGLMSTGLAAVLRDNPEFLDILYKTLQAKSQPSDSSS